MYLSLSTSRRIEMEVESKNFESRDYVIDGVGTGMGWRPQVSLRGSDAKPDDTPERDDTKTRNRSIVAALMSLGGHASTAKLAEATGLSLSRVRRGLSHLENTGKIRRRGRSDWFLVK